MAGRKRAGEFHSSGAFTLSLSKTVLEKLANYQFDFEGAWIVKLVQAAVAKGEAADIKVQITGLEVKIQFEAAWTMDAVENAMAGRMDTVPRDLEHLVTSLRLLAFRRKKPFELRLPSQSTRLAWRNGEFTRLSGDDEMAETFSLTVELSESIIDLSRTGLIKERADLTHALEAYCFVCPVPVCLDGRKLNVLFRSNESNEQFLVKTDKVFLPLKGGFKACELPQWTCPPDTRAYANTLPPRGKCSVPYLRELMAHQERQRARARATLAFEIKTHTQLSSLESRYIKQKSVLIWVDDGVICQLDELPMEPNEIGIQLFCSAEGLDHDISGLKLRQTEDYRSRYVIALERGLEVIEELELYLGFVDVRDFNPWLVALGLVGVATSIATPIPLLAKSALVLGGGAVSFRGKPAGIKLPDLGPSLRELQKQWRETLEE